MNKAFRLSRVERHLLRGFQIGQELPLLAAAIGMHRDRAQDVVSALYVKLGIPLGQRSRTRLIRILEDMGVLEVRKPLLDETIVEMLPLNDDQKEVILLAREGLTDPHIAKLQRRKKRSVSGLLNEIRKKLGLAAHAGRVAIWTRCEDLEFISPRSAGWPLRRHRAHISRLNRSYLTKVRPSEPLTA